MINLQLGDCLELMPQIADESVDMILCDLPYGTTQCSWDIIIPFESLWKEYRRIIKKKGVIALFGTEPFSSELRLSNIKEFKYDWIWEKERPANIFAMRYSPGKVHEIISVFCKGMPIYFPIKEPAIQIHNGNCKSLLKQRTGNDANFSDTYKQNIRYSKDHDFTKRDPRSIIKFARGTRKKLDYERHPNEKPVSLLEYLIKTYTLEGEIVLDNCMGNGSTGVACKNLNRNFIGIEKDQKYFQIAQQRINKEEIQFEIR